MDGGGTAGVQPVVDAAEMLAHVAAAKLIDFRDEAVEKLAVVADDDGRAVKGADGLL